MLLVYYLHIPLKVSIQALQSPWDKFVSCLLFPYNLMSLKMLDFFVLY